MTRQASVEMLTIHPPTPKQPLGAGRYVFDHGSEQAGDFVVDDGKQQVCEQKRGRAVFISFCQRAQAPPPTQRRAMTHHRHQPSGWAGPLAWPAQIKPQRCQIEIHEQSIDVEMEQQEQGLVGDDKSSSEEFAVYSSSSPPPPLPPQPTLPPLVPLPIAHTHWDDFRITARPLAHRSTSTPPPLQPLSRSIHSLTARP